MRTNSTASKWSLGILCAAACACQAAPAYKMASSIRPDGRAPDLAKLKREVAVNYGDEYARKVVEFLRVLDDPTGVAKLPPARRFAVEFDVLYAFASEAYRRAHVLREFLNQDGVQAGAKGAPRLRSRVDYYKVCFSVPKNCHVYVFQMDSTGKIDPFFPNASILPGMGNPVQAGGRYQLPPNPNWAFLDENAGIEKFYIFVSQARKPAIEGLYPYFIDAGPKIVAGTWKRVMENQAKPLDMPPAFDALEETTVASRGFGGQVQAQAPPQALSVQKQFQINYRPTTYVAAESEFVQTLWFHHRR